MGKIHSFHIPVMGTGFSIDTPIKVAKYGISSVISLVDDQLIEQVRKFYCQKIGEKYVPITQDDDDCRAKRITAYLNLVGRIVKKQFAELKASAFEVGSEITKYFELLPDTSPLKKIYQKMLQTENSQEKQKLQAELRERIEPGEIDVNIMTKLDRPNYGKDDRELPSEYSDALAALRGYAESTLTSAVVFSAGINRRLYSYVENFKDFYADAKGFIKKKIILKVSDYRSSITQGKFFAKKGLWVSEYRIESGLNCGGHVFPAAGKLMGPILEEFKAKRQEFIASLHEIYNQALRLKERMTFATPHPVAITAQGGIGTHQEDQFLRDYYELDGTGWASPFLLVPEATNVDQPTLKRLSAATEDDLYTSDVSPLGVPFNNLQGNLSDAEKERKIKKGRPGSSCPKGYLIADTEFTEKPICKASRLYQKLKIDQLKRLKLGPSAYNHAFQEVVQKACICNDLGEGFLLKNDIVDLRRRLFPAVCPGPNIAYFSKIVSLQEMVDHIYGRTNLLSTAERPHMFLKELKVNIDFLIKEIKKTLPQPTDKQIAYLNEFRNNLLEGITYYMELFPQILEGAQELREKIITQLKESKEKLDGFVLEYSPLFTHPAPELVTI